MAAASLSEQTPDTDRLLSPALSTAGTSSKSTALDFLTISWATLLANRTSDGQCRSPVGIFVLCSLLNFH
jgi:hypothetical protein